MSEVAGIRATDGTQLVAEIEGTGPPLLLLHGITEDRASWAPFVAELSATNTLVRLDFRGHGESQTADTASMATMIGDVTRVVEELDLVSPAYIGHSMGGFVATLVAAVNGARSVVCVDQRMSDEPLYQRIQEMRERLHGEGFAEALIELGNAMGLQRVPASQRSRLETARRQANQGLVLSMWHPLFSQSAQSIDEGVTPPLQKIESPYLALHGEKLDSRYLSWIQAQIPHAEVESWPDAGHWLHQVEPQSFLERVIPFLAEHAA